jgi:hypothetical protein
MADQHEPGQSRQRALFFGALGLLGVILAVFAYLIASTHADAKKDLQRRFRDRAQVSAAVAESVFASLGSGASISPVLAAPKIDENTLEKLAAQGKLAYIAVHGPDGKIVAATRSTPAAVRAGLRSDLKPALAGQSTFSGVVPGPTPAKSVIQWGIPFKATDGSRRVEVAGVSAAAMAKFLGSFLGQLPNESASAGAVLDDAGRVVGSPDKGVRVDQTYGDRALLAAMKNGASGSYGANRYFASAPVKGSSWHIVLTADQSKLYAEINGSRRTVPWLVLVALGFIGLAGLVALRRASIAQAEVARRSISRRAALEINDNVIQRLAVVKFALERGEEGATEEKLTEALREAQKLVNQLLGEEGADPGTLRRTGESPRDVL